MHVGRKGAIRRSRLAGKAIKSFAGPFLDLRVRKVKRTTKVVSFLLFSSLLFHLLFLLSEREKFSPLALGDLEHDDGEIAGYKDVDGRRCVLLL